ncbi:MAG: hypothetical protein IJH78_09080 [Clostridia bacterium]|nr:hypothetical protein [Clostridia bacterium]
MKRICLLIAVLLLTAAALAEAPAAGTRPLLVLVWRSAESEGGALVGCLDDAGGLWRGEAAEPFAGESELLPEWLAELGVTLAEGGMVWQEPVGEEELAEIVSLARAVRGLTYGETTTYGGIGQIWAEAFRYDENAVERIPLALGGDICRENGDINAQALFRRLLELFPDLAEPALAADALPAGFVPVPLLSFCGYEGEWPEDVDAELLREAEGEWQIAEEDGERLEAFLDSVDEMAVVCKQSALVPSEGVETLRFEGPSGEILLTIRMYQGMLVRDDGVYRIGVLA